MPLSTEAIQKILGINEKVYLTPREMADQLNITFFPYKENKVSKDIQYFAKRLADSLNRLKVNIVPYDQALSFNYRFSLIKIPQYYFFILFKVIIIFFRRIFQKDYYDDPLVPNFGVISKVQFGKKVKKGIAIIAIGENEERKLPIDYTASFTGNPIITVVDLPDWIDEDTEFHQHFDTAMQLFARHMTHIVIAVGGKRWVLYNMNASHPIYSIDESDEEFDKHLLSALIPKIAAPIRAPRFSEFIIRDNSFNPNNTLIRPLIDDMVYSGSLFEKTKLYPPGKKLTDLPFRNELYQWIGRLHLDGRSGMSYGFLARQLPTKLSKLIPEDKIPSEYAQYINQQNDFFVYNDRIFIIISILNHGNYIMEVPDAWVLTQRSGSKKTAMDPLQDIIKIGLVAGKMILEPPRDFSITSEYRPSFDTKVILAHAVGNAIIGSILNYISPNNSFSNKLEQKGLALSHWHGYINRKHIPHGWHVYGWDKPHVACSTAQSAIYALDGKIRAFEESLNNNEDYFGDIHIEPQHGVNITYSSLRELGDFLNQAPDISKLGNIYLNDY